jgi:Cu(I)/Ag(I) efflux system membrane fusion protein
MNKHIRWMALSLFLAGCQGKDIPPTEEPSAMPPNTLHLSDLQVQLGNIVTDTARLHELGDEIQLTGTVAVNQNSETTVSTRAMGRIEKLYFKIEGETIHKGDPIYRIYSEDLALTAKELAMTVQKKNSFGADNTALDPIIKSAENKLALYGLVTEQIQTIKNAGAVPDVFDILSPSTGVLTGIAVQEGEYMMEGAEIFTLADLSTLWIEAQVYADDLSEIKSAMSGTVTFPEIPGLHIAGTIAFVNPELNPSSKINLVRIEVRNADGQLKPGMLANISVLKNKIHALALPTDAIILDSRGASVWVKTGHNQYRLTMVETGLETDAFTEIKTGIQKGDEVAVSGAYLLTSEFTFKNGVSAMEGHAHGH